MSQAPPHIAAVIGSLQIYEFMLLSFFFFSFFCFVRVLLVCYSEA